MKLTHKQQRFIDEYLIDFNATQAAIRAGYSKDTANRIGSENLSKLDIQEAIQSRLKELKLGADETIKLIGDIAKGNLNKYLKTKKIEYVPRIEVSISEVIDKLQDDIDFEQEYMDTVDLSEKEIDETFADIQRMKKQLARLQLEFKRNPKATRIINGPVEWKEDVDIDYDLLIKDKENGKIKSLTYTKEGPKIEMYAADSALSNLARIHGLFKDNMQVEVLNKKMTQQEAKDFLKSLNDEL